MFFKIYCKLLSRFYSIKLNETSNASVDVLILEDNNTKRVVNRFCLRFTSQTMKKDNEIRAFYSIRYSIYTFFGV